MAERQKLKRKRVGIYAGTFNPVHAGHVAFALQATAACGLDVVYFVPERQPRDKTGVEHFGHRVAMLDRALKPHPSFFSLDLPDVNFSVQRTLPRLQKLFPGSELVFLFGSDVVSGIQKWAYSERFLNNYELVIGVREGATSKQSTMDTISEWVIQPKAVTLIDSYAPGVSSGEIREALKNKSAAKGLLSSVARYSDHNWLYVSLS